MSELNREAIEATKALWPEFEQEAKNLFKCVQNNFGWMPIAESLAQAYAQGRTAALPHLAPQSSQSDELVYSRIMDACSGIGESRIDTVVYAALSAVRAEATLAERGACAKVADERAAELRKQKLFLSDVQAEQLEQCAAAIRSRKP